MKDNYRPKKRSVRSEKLGILILIALCLSGSSVFAQSWVGGVDSLWTTAGNWDNNSVPGFNDNVTINASDRVVLESAIGLCRSITIGTNDTLVIKSGDNLTVDLDVIINGVLTLEGTSLLSYGQDWFRNGIFNYNQSTVTHTGNRAQNIVYSETFYNLQFNKTNQVVTNSAAITVMNDLTITAGTFEVIDSNGDDLIVHGDVIIGTDNTDALDLRDNSADGITIVIGGDFSINNSNANSFQAGTASTIIFNGSGSQRLTPSISGDGETFVNLIVRKNDADRLDIDNPVQVQGDMKIDSGLVKLNGNQLILGTDSADSLIVEGILEIDGGATLKMENGTSLTTNSGGTLSVVGSASNTATVTRNSGTYNFEINSGGTIKARYYTIEYMNTSGLQINDGAIIDATNNFSDGAIDNIASTGTGLNVGDISGSQQRLIIDNVVFPTNPGVGSYNVAKSNSTDTLEFTNSTGNFTGEFFDNDPNNLVIWTNAILTRQWVGNISSDWGTAGNWSPAGAPGPGDNVEIPAAIRIPSITSAASCNDLLIHQNGLLSVGNVALSSSLDINGNLTIGDSTGASNGSLTLYLSSTVNIGGHYYKTDASILNENTSIITLDGDSLQKITSGGIAAADQFYTLTINKSGGTVILADDILILGNFTISNGTFNAGSYDMTVYQNWNNSGTFTAGTGTVTFDAPSAGPFDITAGGSSFNHLTINSANENNVQRLMSNLDINGDLTIPQGTINTNGYDITIGGNCVIDGGNGHLTAGSGTVSFDGTTDQSIDPGTVSFNNFTINKSSGTATLADDLIAAGNLTISSGTFNSAARNINVGGNWNNSSSWTQSGGTVSLAATDAGPYSIGNSGTGSFNNLLLDGTGTTYALTSGINIDGDLTINTGNTLSAGVNTMNCSGDWTNNGTFQSGTGSVVFDGGTRQQVNNGLSSFNLLTINKTADRVELDAATVLDSNLTVLSGELRTDVSLDVNGSISISSGGTYNMNGVAATVFGGLANSGTLSNAGSLTFDGSSGGPYSINSGASSFEGITLNASGLVYQLSGTTDINGNLNITAGKLDLNGHTLTFGDGAADAITVSDTLEIDAGAELSLFSGTSVDFNGGVAYIVGEPANNAVVSEQSKSGSYTFRVNSGATLHARYALFEYMDASGIQLLSGAILDALNNISNVTFDNGTSGGTMLYIENLFGLNQVFTIVSASFPSNPGGGASNVTKSVSSDTLDFQSSTGSFAGEDFDNDPGNLVQWGSVSDLLTWTGSASTNWHTASNWNPVGVPDATKAVLIPKQTNDPVIGNNNAAALEVTIGSGATLTIQDGFDFDIDGNLVNSTGTFIVGSTNSTVNVAGDWSNNGTFTHGNSTVTFDGSDVQYVTGGGTGSGKSLHNLNCINPDTIQLQGTLDVDGDLFILNGCFYMNGNQLIVGESAGDSLSVSGELLVDDDAVLQMADGAVMVVASGGDLLIQGTSIANRPQITNQGSGNYSIDVLSGGAITPKLAIIENTGGNGIQINSGATITSTAKFDSVLFQNGDGTSYITIGNAQTLNTVGVQFDSAATSRPASNVVYTGSGRIRFSDYKGTMSGAGFENDNGIAPYGNVLWDFLQTEVINNGTQTFGNDAVISSTANLGSVTVELIDQTLRIAPASVARYYTVEPQNSTNATVRLYYGEDELGSEVESDLQMWRRRNDVWEQLGGAVNITQNYVEVSSAVYTFSAGVIDTLILSDAQNDASLPVELLSFDAEVLADSVVLKWTTATELENAFWIIERKELSHYEYNMIQDGAMTIEKTQNVYRQLTQIQGMGSKPTSTDYIFVDHDVDLSDVYAYRLSSVSINGEIEYFKPVIASYYNGKTPETYTLEQNYPNPFNPLTTIRYQLPYDSRVIIEVYNILGQSVIRLVDDKQDAGFYDVQWNAQGRNGEKVASGVYIYRMMAEAIDSHEKLSMNKRMVLLK